MKKFSIKTVLILALVLILVLSLVACNKEDDEPTTITATEYFAKLWDVSQGMGNTTIGENQNVAVSADLGVQLMIKGNGYENGQAATVVKQSLGIGIAIDAVLDRQHLEGDNKGTDTALKVKLYNAENGENWVTLYYFMNDTGNIYIDFAGQNIVLPFDYMNDQHASGLSWAVFEQKVVAGKSIGEIVNMLAEQMGPTWNLNSFVNDILTLVENALNADKTGDDVISIKNMIAGIVPYVGLTTSDLYDTNGNIDISKILTNETVASLLFSDTANELPAPTTVGDVTTYRAPLKFNSMVQTLLESVSILKNSQLTLTFSTKNNQFNDFAIEADLPAVSNSSTGYLAARIGINKIEFRGVNAGQEYITKAGNNYSSDIALDINAAIDVTGITIHPEAFGDVNPQLKNVDDITLNGQVKLVVNGKLDIANVGDANTSNAIAYISYKGNESGATEEHLVDVSYVGNKLALKLNQDLKISNVPVAKTLVGALGNTVVEAFDDLIDDFDIEEFRKSEFAKVMFVNGDFDVLNPDFKGAVWDNLSIHDGIQDGITSIIQKFFKDFEGPSKKTDDDSQDAKEAAVSFDGIVNVIKKVIPLISTSDNKLTINVDNINTTVANIGSEFDTNMTAWGNVISILANDRANWTTDIADLLVLSGTKYATAKATLNEKELAALRKYELEYYMGTNEFKGKSEEEVKAAVANREDRLFINRSAEEILARNGKAKAFLTEVMAGSAKVSLGLSANNGIDLGVNVKVGSATISLALNLKASSISQTYTSVGTATATGNGWFYYSF